MSARVAWLLVGVTVACAIAQTAVIAAYRPLMSGSVWVDEGWPLTTAATVGSALMGALIVSRYPRNAVGWLLFVPGLASISLAGGSYAVWVLEHGGPGSDTAAHVSAWVAVLLGAPMALTALTLIFLIAPDGRLPTRSRRVLAWTSVGGLALHVVAVLTIPPPEMPFGEDPDVPALALFIGGVGVALIGLSLIGSAVSLVRRLRRARGALRQQLRWIAFSATFLAAGFALLVLAGGATEQQSWAMTIPLYLGYFTFPICTAVAVLRHRLFDIDLIINRAVLLTIATALVALGYVALVVIVGGNAGGFWPSVAATAVVALAFQPLRSWVVRVADRLAFGPRAAPYEELADFSRRLGESPDPSTLLPAIANAAVQAIGAQRATVRLGVDGKPDLTATSPTNAEAVDDETGALVPVVDGGDTLGSVVVAMPPGRPLRQYDLERLRGLADQASIAFRNIRLSTQLSARVQELARSTAELDESRRRLIEARDRERSRIERAIGRDVMPHLDPLPDQLELLARAGVGVGDRVGADASVHPLESLVGAATLALEALREITRGVFPAQLARGGLGPALTSQLGRSPGNGHVVIDESAAGRRFDWRIEAAAYFCFLEALRDLGPPVEVALTAPDGHLLLTVSGRQANGLTLANMRDRVEAVGGSVREHDTVDRTVIQVNLLVPDATTHTAPDRAPVKVRS